MGSHRRFWSRGHTVRASSSCLLPACPRILYTTYYESIANSSPFFGYYFFNSLLVILQLLHVFWSCLILRMIHSFIKRGQVGPGKGGLLCTTLEPQLSPCPFPVPQMEKDIRSDVEESASSEEEEHPQLKNGAAQGPQAVPADGPRSRAAGRLANGHMLAS